MHYIQTLCWKYYKIKVCQFRLNWYVLCIKIVLVSDTSLKCSQLLPPSDVVYQSDLKTTVATVTWNSSWVYICVKKTGGNNRSISNYSLPNNRFVSSFQVHNTRMEWCMDSKFALSCLPWTEEWIIGLRNINLEQPLWRHVNKRYNFFGTLWAKKDFWAFLLRRIRWCPSFNRWPLLSPRTSHVKMLTDTFQGHGYSYGHVLIVKCYSYGHI